jgi:hypothetical protein
LSSPVSLVWQWPFNFSGIEVEIEVTRNTESQKAWVPLPGETYVTLDDHIGFKTIRDGYNPETRLIDQEPRREDN